MVWPDSLVDCEWLRKAGERERIGKRMLKRARIRSRKRGNNPTTPKKAPTNQPTEKKPKPSFLDLKTKKLSWEDAREKKRMSSMAAQTRKTIVVRPLACSQHEETWWTFNPTTFFMGLLPLLAAQKFICGEESRRTRSPCVTSAWQYVTVTY